MLKITNFWEKKNSLLCAWKRTRKWYYWKGIQKVLPPPPVAHTGALQAKTTKPHNPSYFSYQWCNFYCNATLQRLTRRFFNFYFRRRVLFIVKRVVWLAFNCHFLFIFWPCLRGHRLEKFSLTILRYLPLLSHVEEINKMKKKSTFFRNSLYFFAVFLSHYFQSLSQFHIIT